jgi:hypothetical protein
MQLLLSSPPIISLLCEDPPESCMHICRLVTIWETGCSPSAGCTRGRASCTRGSLPRVQLSGKRVRGRALRGSRLPRESRIAHSGKYSPRGMLALGEDFCFFLKTTGQPGTVGPSICSPLRRRRRRRLLRCPRLVDPAAPEEEGVVLGPPHLAGKEWRSLSLGRAVKPGEGDRAAGERDRRRVLGRCCTSPC